MSAPAAIKATYSDLRFVKSRKIAQVVCEMPIEEAAKFVEMFGTPNPATETWIALARLNGNVTPIEKAKDARRDKLTMIASIRCGEPRFWTFLNEEYRYDIENENDAAEAVREICGVDSRRQFSQNEEAAERWRGVEGKYKAWLLVSA